MPRKQERCRRAAFGEGAKGRLVGKMGLRGLAKGHLVGKMGLRGLAKGHLAGKMGDREEMNY